MAAGVYLVVDFMASDGTSKTLSWGNIDAEASASAYRNFANGVVSNSASLLKTTLTGVKSITIRTTTETNVPVTA